LANTGRDKKKTVQKKEEPVQVINKPLSQRKLLNKERQTLKELPKQIEKMEADRDQIATSMQEADYYRKAENDPLGDQQKLEKLENKILEAYETWEELEELSKV
jgi:ATP-binding cassette subfamily F protein uup